MKISGPHNPSAVSETPSREKVFTCRPTPLSEERSCAESIISRLASQAYRRPVTGEDMAGLVSLYESGGEISGFEVGVRTALQAILASPSFVFRFEDVPEGVAQGRIYPLSDVNLASRLSFFLWGTIPDDELLEYAVQGRLTEPGGLERQVERMLADPRSEALATRFAAQWLRLQDLAAVQPDAFFYPISAVSSPTPCCERRSCSSMISFVRDRSVLDLFTADYTFLNDRLARHYGIPFTGGSGVPTVQYPNEDRRGVLGHGSVQVADVAG